jgi:hypothetical protein
MADLQCLIPHNDPLHEQLQDPLLLLADDLTQSIADLLTKERQVLPYGLHREPLVAELRLLIAL